LKAIHIILKVLRQGDRKDVPDMMSNHKWVVVKGLISLVYLLLKGKEMLCHCLRLIVTMEYFTPKGP
jgi:hypothetical protein